MMYNLKLLQLTIFPSEDFTVGSQSSVAGYSQLPFPAASQTHLRHGTEGMWESLVFIKTGKQHLQIKVQHLISPYSFHYLIIIIGYKNEWTDQLRKNDLMFKHISLTSRIRNIWRTVTKMCLLIL